MMRASLDRAPLGKPETAPILRTHDEIRVDPTWSRHRPERALRTTQRSDPGGRVHGLRLAVRAGGADRAQRTRRQARAGGRDRDAHRSGAVRHPGLDRSHRLGDDPRRADAGQHLREPRRRSRRAGARPSELFPGRPDLGARLRRALDLRHPRRSHVRRRHPGDLARRPGPDHQRRPRFGRPHRSPARAVLGALRQLRGRRDPGLHRRGQRRADRRRRSRGRQLRQPAPVCQGERRDRQLRLCRQRQRLRHRRLPRAQRSRASHRQRQVHLASRRRKQVDLRPQQRRPAQGAGPARPDARRVRHRPARRRSGGDDVQYPKDRRPDPARPGLRAPPRRRQFVARAGLRRPSQHRAVPGDPGRPAGQPAASGRGDRARPRLPRRRPALDRADAARRRAADGRRRTHLRRAGGAATRLPELHRPDPRRRRRVAARREQRRLEFRPVPAGVVAGRPSAGP